MPAPLPIDPLVPAIASSLASTPNAVVIAPPGAGKTTRLAPALIEGTRGAIVMLQPRRVAARAAAARIADERGWRLGEEVGYHIRFENRTSARTRVRVVTEGILARQLQNDPFLDGIGCVILDEFHERSIHTDMALAMLREVQSEVREDLRIVVMSATMDPAPVARFLGDAPVFESEGRLHPVEIEYLERADPAPAWDKAVAAVHRALAVGESAGHILVFLPGIGEIRRVEERLGKTDADVHILHSSVSNDDQDRALRPSARRKIILATNIAETSLTIDGVRTVVDTGTARVNVHDPRLGLDRLELRRISKASAAQRAGRAGRTAPGRCLRLWTRVEDASLEAADVPEIQLVDLASTLLGLRAYGVTDVRSFRWFEAPREDAVARAEKLLAMLGAVDAHGSLTAKGRQLASLPVHPRIGTLLLAGVSQGLVRESASLAALLSEKDIVAEGHSTRRRNAKWQGDSDVLDRLDLLDGDWRAGDVDIAAARAAGRVRDELVRAAERIQAGAGDSA